MSSGSPETLTPEAQKLRDSLTLGVIGQGYVGKNYADSFEDRGFKVVRYSMEEEHRGNREAIATCDLVFIAVPTPTTPEGFDDSIVRDVMQLVGKGKTAVVKSTIALGTTEQLQKDFPEIIVLHNPEFLNEVSARQDVDSPIKTIIGMGADTAEHRARAEEVMAIMPKAPFELITDGVTAEFLKYTHNTFGYSIVLFMNLLYDLAQSYGVAWDPIKESIAKNPWVPTRYLDPVHKGGRGAGGACFIKDFAAFRELYEKAVHDPAGVDLLRAYEKKNIELLKSTGKNLDVIKKVYGDSA